MMKNIIKIFSIAILMTLSSCKKDEGVKNTGVIGKWLLTEIYDAYANGGSNKWNNVPFENSYTLVFTGDGSYTQIPNGTGNGPECKGKYEFQYDKVVITTNCAIEPETLNISELKPTTMIIDKQGIEGTIRYKYKATN